MNENAQGANKYCFFPRNTAKVVLDQGLRGQKICAAAKVHVCVCGDGRGWWGVGVGGGGG